MEAVARVLLLPYTIWLTPLMMALGAVFGLSASWLLYVDRTAIDAVFALYLLSNIAWLVAAIRSRQFWLLLMNAGYLTINLLAVLHVPLAG